MTDRFYDDVNDWVIKVDHQNEDFIKELSKQLAKSLVELTPAKTGRTKRNWRARLNKPPRKPIKAKDKRGAHTLNMANKMIDRAKPGDAIYLVNRWYVAAIINKNPNWPHKKPIRMVERTMSRAEHLVSRTVKKVRR